MRWMVIVGLVCAALFVVDRLALWAESQGLIYWRRQRGSGGTTGGAIGGELLELFSPSRRHLVEEQQRRRLEADAAAPEGPPFGVDLDRGSARIRRPSQEG